VWEALQPLREAFASLAPVFGLIGDGIKAVWEWFTRLLEPANASKETLDKCTRAGELFGKTLGWVIQNIVLGPLTLLLEGLGTVLKWLGVIPDGIKNAQKETQKLQESAAQQNEQKAPVAWEWDPAQKKMVQKSWAWSSDAAENNGDNKPAIPAPAVPGEVKGTAGNPVGNPGSKSPLDEAWFRQGIQKTASNTGGLLEETKKRTGPGDIVFKNLPGPEIIHGEWKAPQVIRTVQAVSAGGGLADVLTTLWQKLTGRQTVSPVPAVNVPAPVVNVARQVSALPQPRNVTAGMTGAVMASAPVAEAIQPPLRPEPAGREAAPQPQAAAFSGEIHVHLHNVNTQNPRELAKLVGEAVREEMRRQARTGMNSFRDRD
ncbi:TPA: phage tail tape measure protein, partial [Escherichia coli]